MLKIRPPYLGAAYYPEDWPLEQIDADIALMKQAGMNIMRIGEFAWSRMEPREGEYDFAWLHLAVDKLGAAGIATIMCTPTCTPPAWMAQKYPDILVQFDDGTRTQHGARRHACATSPTYREHCARIVTKMAKEFGKDPNVIGWQLDNELYLPHGRSQRPGCFCSSCVEGFHAALQKQFGTIEKLNAAWGTDLWSQTYDSFEQVPAPRGDTWHHPSLLTAWANYQSDCYVAFADAQTDILHKLATQRVGTDMMPMNGLHYYKIHRKLDLVQFNHYNNMDNLWQAAFWMDFLRPIKRVPFWNTETATCWNGSVAANGYREPGFCRTNSWLPFALGGEANLYWLWRAHWSGQELMHGSVVSSAGRPLHIFDEVREISDGLQKSADFLRGSKPAESGVAVHFSGYAWWMFMFQPLVHGFGYCTKMLEAVYRPLMQAQWRPDIIDPSSNLAKYRLVFSPFLPALDEENLRGRLRKWIEKGGTWIAGPFTDIRTLHAAKFPHAPYGSLEEWVGVHCKYEIPGHPRDFKLQWQDGRVTDGSIWYDALELRGAKALATYTEGPMKGLAAVARKKLGKGQIVVLGTMPRAEDLQALLQSVGRSAKVAPSAKASPNLLVVPREGRAGKGLVVVELENKEAKLTLPRAMTDLLTGQQHKGEIAVAPYSVMVLKQK